LITENIVILVMVAVAVTVVLVVVEVVVVDELAVRKEMAWLKLTRSCNIIYSIA
jgi:hypothetical protein